MPPLKKTARIAGFLYLLVVLMGPFVLIYVPGKLFVHGNPAATASNILGHEALFRSYLVIEFLSELIFIATVLVLYQLLKGVSRPLASVMAILVLLEAPLAFVSVVNDVATLSFLKGGGYMAALDPSQRQALAMFLRQSNGQAIFISEMFWGLWLLPLGMLVWRSGFIPRFLGGWLFVNGLAYVGMSLTGLVSPEHADRVSTLATPVLLGEVAFTLWLLIVGVRSQAPEAAAA